jgi:hypothetical protein
MISTIRTCTLPDDALLRRYQDSGDFTDCYVVDIASDISQADYVSAFYTTWLFRIERLILRIALNRPSSDADVQRLAAGESQSFAAWSVEARSGSQLLLCDMHGRTRSWLMSLPAASPEGPMTRLYFGSAVVSRSNPDTGRASMGWIFRALLGFHALYSRLLLRAAASRLTR